MMIYTSLIYAVHYVAKIVPVIAIGILVTNYAINTGLMRKFNRLVLPISGRANISGVSALSVVTCMFSATAAYSMLSEERDAERITEREVIATTLISSFPGILSHLFTYFLPVVIPILGFTTGMIYICLRGLVALVKTFLGFVLARMWLGKNVIVTIPDGSSAHRQAHKPDNDSAGGKNNSNAWKKSLKTTYRMLKRIVPVMFVTLFLVAILMETGVFQDVSKIIEPVTAILGLESEIALVSATEILNTYSGLILADSFFDTGALSTKGVLIALMLGNVISFSTRFAKHSLPLHVSLFGPKLGSKIVAINGVATLVIDIVIIIVLISI
ncbi:MAG: hypothetical protein C5S49_00295 [Candidatus Methanogaster sp.]|nr:MAG: hypothetical protein C5S49_00295 [ANME-2 cluster archaeon]